MAGGFTKSSLRRDLVAEGASPQPALTKVSGTHVLARLGHVAAILCLQKLLKIVAGVRPRAPALSASYLSMLVRHSPAVRKGFLTAQGISASTTTN